MATEVLLASLQKVAMSHWLLREASGGYGTTIVPRTCGANGAPAAALGPAALRSALPPVATAHQENQPPRHS
ncbi:hypothetical protein EYF80_028676 [Liparis tanakae]|uniref:Uncharacterized protein n=1 Tax=Liparis tanakae TaxID=230148 RepID=A0A4Z2H5L8_9TELE|nr:hypothetical protein EYF80_028676 [Liparis tanakae]